MGSLENNVKAKVELDLQRIEANELLVLRETRCKKEKFGLICWGISWITFFVLFAVLFFSGLYYKSGNVCAPILFLVIGVGHIILLLTPRAREVKFDFLKKISFVFTIILLPFLWVVFVFFIGFVCPVLVFSDMKKTRAEINVIKERMANGHTYEPEQSKIKETLNIKEEADSIWD